MKRKNYNSESNEIESVKKYKKQKISHEIFDYIMSNNISQMFEFAVKTCNLELLQQVVSQPHFQVNIRGVVDTIHKVLYTNVIDVKENRNTIQEFMIKCPKFKNTIDRMLWGEVHLQKLMSVFKERQDTFLFELFLKYKFITTQNIEFFLIGCLPNTNTNTNTKKNQNLITLVILTKIFEFMSFHKAELSTMTKIKIIQYNRLDLLEKYNMKFSMIEYMWSPIFNVQKAQKLLDMEEDEPKEKCSSKTKMCIMCNYITNYLTQKIINININILFFCVDNNLITSKNCLQRLVIHGFRSSDKYTLLRDAILTVVRILGTSKKLYVDVIPSKKKLISRDRLLRFTLAQSNLSRRINAIPMILRECIADIPKVIHSEIIDFL